MGRKNKVKNKKQTANIKEAYGESYTKEELEDKYYIESEAYGGILCTDKQTGVMVVFICIVTEKGKVYCKVGV